MSWFSVAKTVPLLLVLCTDVPYQIGVDFEKSRDRVECFNVLPAANVVAALHSFSFPFR